MLALLGVIENTRHSSSLPFTSLLSLTRALEPVAALREVAKSADVVPKRQRKVAVAAGREAEARVGLVAGDGTQRHPRGHVGVGVKRRHAQLQAWGRGADGKRERRNGKQLCALLETGRR